MEVSVRDWGNRVDLRVDDSGPGIPEDRAGRRLRPVPPSHRCGGEAPASASPSRIRSCASTQGSWHIGVAELGGSRMEISWRKALRAQGKASPVDETLSEALA